MLARMKPVSIPGKRRRVDHAASNGHLDATGRAQALAFALVARMLRRRVPLLRTMLPPSRVLLASQLRRRALRRAEEQRKRERRRKVALATTGVAVGAALTAARALQRR